MSRLSATDLALVADLSRASCGYRRPTGWSSTSILKAGTTPGCRTRNYSGGSGSCCCIPKTSIGQRAARDLAARTQGQIRIELRLKRSDGQYRLHYLSTRSLLGDYGQIFKWIGAAFDIEGARYGLMDNRTAQRETDEALIFLESVEARAPVGLSVVDRDFRYLRVNRDLAAANRLEISEHLGERVATVVPQLWDQIEPNYRRVLETGQPVLDVRFADPLATASSNVHTWLESYYPILRQGEVVGVGTIVSGLAISAGMRPGP